MKPKWTKIKCYYFANHLTNNKKVLEVINPETGSVDYLPLPDHPLTKKVGTKGKPLWVYFDSFWRIKRMLPFKVKKISRRQIDKILKDLENSI